MTANAKEIARKAYSLHKPKKKVKPTVFKAGRKGLSEQQWNFYCGIGNGNCSPAEAPKYLQP